MLFVPTYPQLDFSKIKPIEQQVSVSGISSGAYMANQLHFSHSENINSATLFAGGPYYCSRGSTLSALNECMKTNEVIDITNLQQRITSLESLKLIDSLDNLKNDNITLVAGLRDDIVDEEVSNKSYELFKNLGVKNLKYLNQLDIAHTFPTISKGNDCNQRSASPFISSCNIDGAKIVFDNIAENVKPAKKAAPERLFYVKQWGEDLFATYYLSQHAVAYVPAVCEEKSCKLHVSFHGCKQSRIEIGEKFIMDTGLIEYAEANNTIVLFPQTLPNYLWNPNGCWDWWGYSGSQFHTRNGTQVKTIYSIIKKFLK